MKKVSISVIAVLATVFGVAYCLNEAEKESNVFGSYEEVVESGLIDHGWIPEFIPTSAYDIKEKHRVDVPSIHVELKFVSGDVKSFEAACEKIREGKYSCQNSGYPVEVIVTNDNYATIRSLQNGT